MGPYIREPDKYKESVLQHQEGLVLNLSNVELSKHQLAVLGKGLSFIPTSRSCYADVILDIKTFTRNLTLKLLYKDNNSVQRAQNVFSKPSSFIPNNHMLVNAFEKLCIRDIYDTCVGHGSDFMSDRYSNLSRHEKCALKELENDTRLTIRPADKGGLIVVLDKNWYEAQMFAILCDSSFYEELDAEHIFAHIGDVHVVLKGLLEEQLIDEKLLDYFLVDKPTIPILQGLPKVHKSTSNPPMRPIVSSRDVVSLFTVIPNTEGLAAIQEFLRNSTQYTADTIILLLQLLELVAMQNTFLHNFVERQLDVSIVQLEEELHASESILYNVLNDSLTREITNFSQFIVNLSSCVLLDRFQPMGSLDELEKKAQILQQQNNLLASIIFNDSSKPETTRHSSNGSLSKHIDYTIRTNVFTSMRTDRLMNPTWKAHPKRMPMISFCYNYFFVPLQDMIERALIEVLTGQEVKDPIVQVQAMPYPCHVRDEFLNQIGYFFPLIMMLSWTISVASMVRKLVYEKELYLEEYMKIMGVSPMTHFLAWFLENFAVMTACSATLVIILKASRILTYSNGLIVFLFFLDFGTAVIMLSYLTGSLFSNANTAALSASLFYVISFLPFMVLIVMQKNMTLTVQTILCLLSTTAFSQGVFFLSFFEGQQAGIQWHNMYQSPTQDDVLTFGWICWMILIDSVIYFLIGFYIHSIHPDAAEELDIPGNSPQKSTGPVSPNLFASQQLQTEMLNLTTLLNALNFVLFSSRLDKVDETLSQQRSFKNRGSNVNLNEQTSGSLMLRACLTSTEPSIHNTPNADNIQSTEGIQEFINDSIPAAQHIPRSVSPTDCLPSNEQGNVFHHGTGLIGTPLFNEWVTNISNLSFGNGLNQERLASICGNQQVSLQLLSEKLNLFDSKLLKLKKHQLEKAYFNECLNQRIVQKGLRFHQYPIGLIADSPFHLELTTLFNQQGFDLLQLMMKHYMLQIEILTKEVSALNTDITSDIDFLRYKFDYERCFTSIDQLLERLKYNKIKKMNRDRTAYENGSAYPKPSVEQVATISNVNISPTQQDNESNVVNNSNNSNRGSNVILNQQTSGSLILRTCLPSTEPSIHNTPNADNIQSTKGIQESINDSIPAAQQIPRSVSPTDCLPLNEQGNVFHDRTGLIGTPVFNEWVTNISNLSFGNGLNQERLAGICGNQQVSLQLLSEKLKLFDSKLLKLKKLQLEVAYFNECLNQRIVPKGLRFHQYPTGLIADSSFHLELITLFNQQGFDLLQLMMKHYMLQIEILTKEVSALNTDITSNFDFLRGLTVQEQTTGEDEEDIKGLDIGVALRSITMEYNANKTVAVRNLTFTFYRSHITTLLGPNGAGKTTTISMLTGLCKPSSGTIYINGKNMRAALPTLKQDIGFCPQHDVLFDYLTVYEHLLFYGAIKAPHWTKKQLYSEVNRALNDIGLSRHQHKQVGTLSGGMKRKLSISISFLGNSTTVILDEPTSGVDPCSRRSIWDIMLKYRAGRTIILTTHHLDEAEVLSNRIAILEQGQLKCYGSPAFLRELYGQGCKLTFNKKPSIWSSHSNCDSVCLTSLVQKYIPEASLKEDIGRELTYLIPSAVDKTACTRLFEDLEKNLDHLHLNSYGISDSALEEVFLQIVQEIEKKPFSHHVNMNNVEVLSSSSTQRDSNFLMGNMRVSGGSLVLSQIIAVLLKRFHYTRRDWKGALAYLVLPVLFVAMAMGLFTIKLLVIDYPSLKLVPELYNSAEHLFFRYLSGTPHQRGTIEEKVQEEALGSPEESFTEDTDFDEGKVPMCRASPDDLVSNFTNSKGHHLYNLTGYNIEDFLLWTSKKLLNKRYGGWSFGEILPSDLKPKNNSHTVSLSKAWYNQKGYHAEPAFLNHLHNLLLWANLPPNTDWNQYGITLHSYPYGGSLLEEDKILESARQSGVALCMTLGYSILTAVMGASIVRDRVSGGKRLQHTAGLSHRLYWFSNFFYDMMFYLIPVGLCIGVIAAFQVTAFTFRENLAATALLLILFGYSTLPWMYLISRYFTSPDIAFITFISINFVVGVSTVISVFLPQLLAVISNLQGLHQVYSSLQYAFIIFPPFCLGHGLIQLSYNQMKFDLTSRYGIDSYLSPFQMDFLGWIFLAMALEGSICLIVRLTLHMDILRWKNKHSVLEPSISVSDKDVNEERARVFRERGTCDDVLLLYNLEKKYQHFNKMISAVNGISLGVPRGECFGLLGVNGAGKTTTFKMLTGDIAPSTGYAAIRTAAGTEIDIISASKDGRLIGYCPQQDALDELLTGWEHLVFYCRLHGIPNVLISKVAGDLVSRLHLNLHIHKLVKTYSGGTKRKLSTALALIGRPQVLLLDEPSSGMDPRSKRYLWKTILNEVQNGCAALLTSHSMEECEALCSRLAIMVNGQFRCLGSPQHIKNRFGDGYSVKVWFSKEARNQSAITECLMMDFPGTYLKEQHHDLLEYQVPHRQGGLGEMFRVLESCKKQSHIKHYSVSQTTLDQVFINFAMQQKETTDQTEDMLSCNPGNQV
ncbi:ATP-binding cassette sub-family A member 13-like [Protopterus annectens]|uniref:ATP-binding cassette sub-family A member 13-like n=1 Tax=Protopterus annectens TaxID=7888 RepID=UPI001CFB34DB|nr:ATP-binding cassette sub-family A member 13-like [Protopterus annectens]